MKSVDQIFEKNEVDRKIVYFKDQKYELILKYIIVYGSFI